LAIFAVLAVFALVAVGVIVVVARHHQSPASSAASSATMSTDAGAAGQPKSVHIAAPNVATKPGSTEPKVQLVTYEDFLCPVCGAFESMYAQTINQLIDSGQIAVDYTLVSVLGQHKTSSYSVRAGAAGYCVADADTAAFRRFHAALFANQPDELGTSFPGDDQLIAQAAAAGATGSVPDCVHSGKYLDMVNNAAENANIEGTPTVYLNGVEIGRELLMKRDPRVLLDKVQAVTGS
jgi:protein-disulfide isomerase